MEKKGNINQLFPAVLAIILVGALIVIGIGVLGALQDTTYLNTAAGVINESLPLPTDAGIILTTGSSARNGICGAVTSIINGSSGAGFGVGLTNITQVGCTIYNASSKLGATGLNLSSNIRYSYPYTFDNATVSSNAIGSVNTSLGTLATTWLPIIIVVLAAGIVLAVLLGAFSKKKK